MTAATKMIPRHTSDHDASDTQKPWSDEENVRLLKAEQIEDDLNFDDDNCFWLLAAADFCNP